MGLETGTYIDDLVASNPVGAVDAKSQGDDHLRLIKSILQATFPSASRAFYFESSIAKTGGYTVLAADQRKLIRCDASGGAFTVTLPLISTVFDGFVVSVVKTDSSATAVTVDGNGAETINGATTRTLAEQYLIETYFCDGTEWWVQGQSTALSLGTWASKTSLVSAKTGAYTALIGDDGKLITCDATGGAFTITLPPVAIAIDGYVVAIKKIDSSANAVTIDADGTETIDGALTQSLADQYDCLILRSDGTVWHIVAELEGAASGVDVLVKVSSNDTTAGYLNGKLIAGSNITLTEGSDGANETLSIASTAASSSVGQSELNTTIGEVSRSGVGSANVTLPGGSYGFYPQYKRSGTAQGFPLMSSQASADLTNSSYVTNAFLQMDGGTGTIYMQQRYVSASPPYDLGDGEVFGFVFGLIQRGKLVATYTAFDPPWANNGPTDIRPHMKKNGKSYRRQRQLSLTRSEAFESRTKMEQYLNEIETAPMEFVEIDQAWKQKDMAFIPQPFQLKPGDQVFLLDPMDKLIQKLLDEQSFDPNFSIGEMFETERLKADNTTLSRKGPLGIKIVKPLLR